MGLVSKTLNSNGKILYRVINGVQCPLFRKIDVDEGMSYFDFGDDFIGPIRINGVEYYSSPIILYEPIYSIDCSNNPNISRANFTFTSTSLEILNNLFSYCTNLQRVNISGIVAPNLRSTEGMFNHATNLQEVNLEGFDTSNVTNMYGMFRHCSATSLIGLNQLDTSKVTNMANMFEYCNVVNRLDLSSFNTLNVTDMSYMFYHCTNLDILDLANFTINSSTTTNMFLDCVTLDVVFVDNCNDSTITKLTSALSSVGYTFNLGFYEDRKALIRGY